MSSFHKIIIGLNLLLPLYTLKKQSIKSQIKECMKPRRKNCSQVVGLATEGGKCEFASSHNKSLFPQPTEGTHV